MSTELAEFILPNGHKTTTQRWCGPGEGAGNHRLRFTISEWVDGWKSVNKITLDFNGAIILRDALIEATQ